MSDLSLQFSFSSRLYFFLFCNYVGFHWLRCSNLFFLFFWYLSKFFCSVNLLAVWSCEYITHISRFFHNRTNRQQTFLSHFFLSLSRLIRLQNLLILITLMSSRELSWKEIKISKIKWTNFIIGCSKEITFMCDRFFLNFFSCFFSELKHAKWSPFDKFLWFLNNKTVVLIFLNFFIIQFQF